MASQVDATGAWNTMDVRPWNEPRLENSQVLGFQKNQPNLVPGLNWCDMGNNANFRLRLGADNQSQEKVKVSCDSWYDSTLYSAGMSFLEVYDFDRDFQFGSFDTQEVRPWDKPALENSKQVTFSRPFARVPPRIVVWLTGFDCAKGQNLRVKTYATDITKTGFRIHIDSWYDTVQYSAYANWIAYPADTPRIHSGSYNIMDVRPWDKPTVETKGGVQFPADKFASIPRIVSAINSIDISCEHNVRFKNTTSDISEKGFTWHCDTWGDSKLFSMGCSYIALDEGPGGHQKPRMTVKMAPGQKA